MVDNRFQPVNQAHAIVEMIVFFEFIQGLGENVERLLSLSSELSDDFPSSQILGFVELNLGQDAQQKQTISQATPKPGGIELRRTREGNSLEWLIRITRDSISIHCLEYTHWEDVWREINRYIAVIFEKLIGINIDIAAIGLKYVDQFLYQGDFQSYNAGLLLNQKSEFLHPKAFSSDCRWHCHTGWYEKTDAHGDILSQLNVDSYIANHNDKSVVIIIENTLSRRANNESELALYFSSEDARANLVSFMHDVNKRLLCDLLIEEVQNQISLQYKQII